MSTHIDNVAAMPGAESFSGHQLAQAMQYFVAVQGIAGKQDVRSRIALALIPLVIAILTLAHTHGGEAKLYIVASVYLLLAMASLRGRRYQETEVELIKGALPYEEATGNKSGAAHIAARDYDVSYWGSYSAVDMSIVGAYFVTSAFMFYEFAHV